MKTFLNAQGFDAWRAVVDGYKSPSTTPTDKDGKKLKENNSKAKGTILNSLVGSVFVKVILCASAKDLWDKLQNIYEEDAKVNGVKFKIFIDKFEQLKMKKMNTLQPNFYELTK